MSSYEVTVYAGPSNTINVTLASALVTGNATTPAKKPFTATQGQTTFDLGETPVADSTHVDVNGISQHETENYDVSGTNIVFTIGLDAGDKVEVRYAKI